MSDAARTASDPKPGALPAGGGPEALERWETSACALLLLWFAARIVFLAVSVDPAVPPDESTHLGRILVYARTWGVPSNGPGNFALGLLDQRPWLYYWTMARVLSLNVFGVSDLVFLRLANGALGVATIWIGILWVREWCASVWARVGFAVLATHLLMFTGLSAAVSYDNGANLLAVSALLAFTRLRRTGELSWLLGLGVVVLAGCLTKRTFLPLAALLFVLLLAREWRRIPSQVVAVGRRFREPRIALLLAMVGLGFVFAAELYAGNWIRYGALQPRFEQVVGEQNAMANRITARNRILEQLRAGEIDAEEARRRARAIRHAGDRRDTLMLIRRTQLFDSVVLGPVAYARSWSESMLRWTVGYMGHRTASKTRVELMAYQAVGVLALLGLAWGWRRGAGGGVPTDAFVLVVGYALVLLWLVNYPAYQSSRFTNLGVQGRYLFPVLVPLMGLIAWGAFELSPRPLRPWLVAVVGAGFVYGDLPWLLLRAGDAWWMPR